ncbi:GGDEF domain-containing protein [Mycolicibacterium komossense]|uniref:GGDEF domain-containing protein n=1 Tax=Mycolicibacterium komossense TaxID=1779 RepID=A0ABT3CG11_9MYCO|nr:GGDEF domain-containing protein [Mycolicibacterium komossense]MCV7228356.1 GGDEF domain-containing protein [Mycolicibacterium komossense]
MSIEGPHSLTRRFIVIAIYATTIPVSSLIFRTRLDRLWRLRHTDRRHMLPRAFVCYGDIGLGAALFTFTDAEAAMYGAALFAIIGIYAATFASKREVIAHAVFVTLIVTVLAALTWRQGHHDAAGVVARWIVSVLCANSTLGMLHGFTRGVQCALNTQLDNATCDPLTGLLNRRGLALWSEQLLGMSPSLDVGFIVVDLDHFKAINDNHGHETGDAVLCLVGDQLRRVAGATATIARSGGDEFVLLIAGPPDVNVSVANAIRVAVADGVDGQRVTASVGVASLEAAEILRVASTDALGEGLRRADIAMYEAKQAGRNQVRTYTPEHMDVSWPDHEQRMPRSRG